MSSLLRGNLQSERCASRICLSRSCIKFNPRQSVSLLHCGLCGNSVSRFIKNLHPVRVGIHYVKQKYNHLNLSDEDSNVKEMAFCVCFASEIFYVFPSSGGLIHWDVCQDEFKFHIFPPCPSWKALSSWAWGTVCQEANGPLWQYNLMPVPASLQVILSTSAAKPCSGLSCIFCFYQDAADECYQRGRNEIWGV